MAKRIYLTILVAVILLEFGQVFSQRIPGLNLSNRRIVPPRVAPPKQHSTSQRQSDQQSPQRQVQQQPQAQRQQGQPQARYPYINPGFFSQGALARRMNDLENDMRLLGGQISAEGNNLRVTMTRTLSMRLGALRQEFTSYDRRVSSNEEKVQGIGTEMEYLKNSNAHMQKRLDRLEESQRQQDQKIQSILESVTALQDPSSSHGSQRQQDVVNSTEFRKLTEAMEHVKLRMNDTVAVVGGYDSYFQSFANNLNMISKKTETLQLESSIVSETLTEINRNIADVQNQVDNLDNVDSSFAGVAYGGTPMDDLQMAVDEISESIRAIETVQHNHTSAIQNLEQAQNRTNLGAASFSAQDTNQGSQQMISQITAAVINLQEALLHTNENQRIAADRFGVLMSGLKKDIGAQQGELLDAVAKFDTFANSHNVDVLQDNLAYLNNTVTKHYRILTDLSTRIFQTQQGPASDSGSPPETNQTEHRNSVPLQDPSLPSNIEMDNRILQLEEYLTTNLEMKIVSMEDDFRIFQFTIYNYGQRIDEIAAEIKQSGGQSSDSSSVAQSPFLARSSISPSASTVSKDDRRIQGLIEDLEALNSSITVQSSMLAEGFHQLGDYDRRLRAREQIEHTKVSDMEEIRILLENATVSLSQMSFTVAEHEITIPSIFEAINMGDTILGDLNSEVYKHEMSLQSLNRTLGRMERELSNSHKMQPQTQHLSSDNQLRDNTNYVTRDEFDGLAEALAGVAARSDMKDSSASPPSDVINMTSLNTNNIKSIRREMALMKNLIESQESSTGTVSQSYYDLRHDLDDVTASVTAWRRNMTNAFALLRVATPKTAPSSKVVVNGLKRLRLTVMENRRLITNHRKRFRIFTFLKRHCARHSDVNQLNQTISAELHSLHDAMQEVASNVTSFSDMLPVIEAEKNLTLLDGEMDFVTIADLVRRIANISKRVDNIQTTKAASSNSQPNSQSPLGLPDDLLGLPTAVRLLETQVWDYRLQHGKHKYDALVIQSFHEVVGALPALDNKIEALKGMRNLVFRNSQGISSFHETVANIEIRATELRRDISSVETSHARLESYHDDLRVQLNSTKQKIDRTDDRVHDISRNVINLGRVFRGNLTELRDRDNFLNQRQHNGDKTLSDITQRLDGLQSDVAQQVLAESLRDGDLDSRLTRLQGRVDDLQPMTSRHEERLDSLNRSLLHETTLRSRTGGEQEGLLHRLRETLTELDGRVGEDKREHEQRLADLNFKHKSTTDAIASNKGMLDAHFADIRTSQASIRSIESDYTLLNERVNNAEDGLADVREALAAQELDYPCMSYIVRPDDVNCRLPLTNEKLPSAIDHCDSTTSLQARQNFLTISDDINQMRQNVQIHESFVKRAEQVFNKYRTDISFVLEHASNHSVAIERLKQRLGYDRTETFANITRGILEEMRLFEQSLQSTNSEMASIRRKSNVQESSYVQIERRLTDLSNSALEYQSKIRLNKEFGDRLQNELRRETNKIRELEITSQDQKIASDDLQQVVISNHNKIQLLGNIRSMVERLQSDSDRFFAKHENRSHAVRNLYEKLNRKLGGVKSTVSAHERTLTAMRQDRISLDSDIEQIYRSSSSLEEILRKTVSDLQDLQRNFVEASGQLSSIEDLQSKLSKLQASSRDASLTMVSNENKLSRVQGTVEALSNSVSRVVSSLDRRDRTDHSRDQARANEIRDIRQNVDRVPIVVRTLRAELSRQSQRLNQLSNMLVSLDRRIDQRPYYSSVDQTDESTLDHSGFLPTTNERQEVYPTTFYPTQENSFENISAVNTLLMKLADQVGKLQSEVELLQLDSAVKMPNVPVDYISKIINLEGGIQTAENVNTRLRALLVDLETRVTTLTTRLGTFENTRAGTLEDKLQELRSSVTRHREASNATCFKLFTNLSKRVGNMEVNVKHGLAANGAMTDSLNGTLVELHTAIRQMGTDTNITHSLTQNNVDALQSSLLSLDTDVVLYASRLDQISGLVASLGSNVANKSETGHIHSEAMDRVVDLLRNEMNESSSNFAKQLQQLSYNYQNASETLFELLQSTQALEELSKSTNNHSHDSMGQEISDITSSLNGVGNDIRQLKLQVEDWVGEEDNRYNQLGNKLADSETTITWLTNKVDEHEAYVSSHEAISGTFTEALADLYNEVEVLKNASSPPGGTASDFTPDAIITELDDLVRKLTLQAEITQSLVNSSSKLTIRATTDWNYEEQEPAYENDEPSVYVAYPDLINLGDINNSPAKSEDTVQGALKNTNKNVDNILSHIINTLKQIVSIIGNSTLSGLPERKNMQPVAQQATEFDVIMTDLSRRVGQLEVEQAAPNEHVSYKTVANFSNNLTNRELEDLRQNVSQLQQMINSWTQEKEEIMSSSSTLRRNHAIMSDDVERHDAMVFKLLSDVSYINMTLREMGEAVDLQEQGLSNILYKQELQVAEVEQWRLLFPVMQSSIDEALSVGKSSDMRNNEAHERLQRQVIDAQSAVTELEAFATEQMGVIAVDITQLNDTLQSTKSRSDKNREEIEQRRRDEEGRRFSELQMDIFDDRLNDINGRQDEIETLLRNTHILTTGNEQDLFAVTERFSRYQNETNQAFADMSGYLQIQASEAISQSRNLVSALDNKLTPLLSILTTDGINVRNELIDINATLRENKRELSLLQVGSENTAAINSNTQLALKRHAKEIQGFTRTFTAVEDLIRTLSETLSLNSDQITMITGDIQASTDHQSATLILLTQMLNNHSIDIDEMNEQIATLMRDNKNRASIRVVIPSQAPRPTTATTTQPTTTTTLAEIPIPTGLKVISSTETEIDMSWLPVQDPTVKKYSVVLQNIRRVHQSFQFSSLDTTLTATGLDPGSKYLIALHSVRNNVLGRPQNIIGETQQRFAPRPIPRPTVQSSTEAVTSTTSTVPPLVTQDPNAIDSLTPAGGTNHGDSADLYCDFENDDLCNFLNDDTDIFDWLRSNGSTPSSDTGPSSDHTLGTEQGNYMFIEASRPRQPGHSARLLSPLLEPTTGQCLEFFYHMYGAGTGDLKVHVQAAGATTRTQFWGETGNHRNLWKRGKTTIVSDQPFRLVFEAIRGTDYHGDTAFDDVVLRPGVCPKPMLQCDFEQNDICGFTQDTGDDFDWVRSSGATSSADTGPITDHTFANAAGNYIFLEASNPRLPGDITRISSPTMKPTMAQCLQFYYHMHGVDIDSFKIFLRRDSNPTDLGIAIWSRTGPQGNDWILGRTTIVSTSPFQIVFQASRGSDYHGDIALDDVTVTNGNCDQPVCSVGSRFGDLCYKVQEEGLNYNDASNNCKAKGGILAAVKTQEQQDFLADLVSGYGNQWTLFWIGLDDLGVEGRFVFSDGQPLARSGQSFVGWAPSEPNDALGDEDCVTMEYQTKNRRWNDVPCNREQWFICQFAVSL